MLWRIRDRATFDALRRSDHRARRGPVTATYTEAGSSPVPQVAYAVGKRAGNAVTRNRIRRRLRSAAASAAEGLRPGAYLLSAGSSAAAVPYEELKTQVASAMTSASNGSPR